MLCLHPAFDCRLRYKTVPAVKTVNGRWRSIPFIACTLGMLCHKEKKGPGGVRADRTEVVGMRFGMKKKAVGSNFCSNSLLTLLAYRVAACVSMAASFKHSLN